MEEENKKANKNIEKYLALLNNKKVPPMKAEPEVEDLVELLEWLTPNDIRGLYFAIVGILQARGYKLIN